MDYSFHPSPHPMHIPDGFLSLLVAISFWILSIILVGIALRKTQKSLGERQVPLMGVLAAAIFAGQLLNFSVTGGTSGHLLGAAIATILVGPWAAILIMTSVVSIQALLFQDGGILSLGANIFNMAIVGVLVANVVFRLLSRLFKQRSWGYLLAGFVAAWASIFVAALACAIELSISGTSPANLSIPAMGVIHALIGIGEGLITVGALSLIMAARKDLLNTGEGKTNNDKGILIGGGLLALVLVILSPLASIHPDGLEWVAEHQGFLGSARDAFYKLLPDYTIPGISNPALTTIVAGIIGVLLVFLVSYLVGQTVKRKSSRRK
jgi:cobalt/nickel transport system permease protein